MTTEVCSVSTNGASKAVLTPAFAFCKLAKLIHNVCLLSTGLVIGSTWHQMQFYFGSGHQLAIRVSIHNVCWLSTGPLRPPAWLHVAPDPHVPPT